MLLEFSVKNYKVFKERATMSFIASNYDKSTLETSNVMTIDSYNIRVLRSAVLYGANASGKTKFFEALEFFRRFVRKSSKEGQKGEIIDIQPFLLSETTEHGPSEFEIVFLHDSVIYRYGFEANSKAVLAEWLFYRPQSKEYQVFYRDTLEPSIKVDKTLFKKGNLLIQENLVRDNALMLSVAAQFNDEICSRVINWFNHNLRCLSCLNESGYKGYSMFRADDKNFHDGILNLVKKADLSIQDITMETSSIDTLPEEVLVSLNNRINQRLPYDKIKVFSKTRTTHNKYDEDNRINSSTEFSMEKEESHGTRKFFYLAGPILDTLENGRTLLIDELDARLHPMLVLRIFRLFNNPVVNRHGAQLIATTHNTSLLKNENLRKDQIWFVEKDTFEASHLYSLADFKSTHVRTNENFEANYLKGKYGATPYLEEIDSFINKVSEES